MVGNGSKKEQESGKSLPQLEKKKADQEKSLAKTTDEDDKDDLRSSINHLSIEIGMIRKQWL